MASCTYRETEAYIFGITTLFWLVVSNWWIVNNRFLNPTHVKSLHHVLTLALFFKFLLSLFTTLMSYTCTESPSHNYWNLGFGSTYCLYNTFLYTSFILISKGYCFTRDYFERNEINMIALIMGGIYIAYSIYLLVQQYLIILIILLLLLVWHKSLKNSAGLRDILTLRIGMMNANRLTASVEATKNKLLMVQRFRTIINIYFVATFACTAVSLVTDIFGLSNTIFTINTAVEELFEIVGLFGICVVFCARFRGQYFDLPDFGMENEARGVTPMYEANLEPSVEIGRVETGPIMIRQPFEDDGSKTEVNIVNYMVAMPIRMVFRRASIDELREPLLSRNIANE